LLNTIDGLNEQCEITSINKGTLKGILLVEMHCEKHEIIFDIVNDINTFTQKEKVNVVLSKIRPEFGPEDFCGHGYIVTQKKNESGLVTIISIFGLLVKIIDKDDNNLVKDTNLNIMDHIYFCVKKSQIDSY
jgi:DNA-directed RNA polymerase subunit G